MLQLIFIPHLYIHKWRQKKKMVFFLNSDYNILGEKKQSGALKNLSLYTPCPNRKKTGFHTCHKISVSNVCNLEVRKWMDAAKCSLVSHCLFHVPRILYFNLWHFSSSTPQGLSGNKHKAQGLLQRGY